MEFLEIFIKFSRNFSNIFPEFYNLSGPGKIFLVTMFQFLHSDAFIFWKFSQFLINPTYRGLFWLFRRRRNQSSLRRKILSSLQPTHSYEFKFGSIMEKISDILERK